MSKKFIGVQLVLVGAAPVLLGVLAFALPGARPFAAWILVPGLAVLGTGIALVVVARRRGEVLYPTPRSFRSSMRATWIGFSILAAAEVALGLSQVVGGDASGWVWLAVGGLGVLSIAVAISSARPPKRWPKPGLVVGESVLWGSVAQHASARFSPGGGLTLTDRRLAFVLSPSDRGFGLNGAEWPLVSIVSADLQTVEWDGYQAEPASRLAVTTTEGKTEVFAGPDCAAGLHALRAQLERAGS